MKLKIILNGRPASKKNNRRNYGHVSLPSKAFERFKEDALWQLKPVKRKVHKPFNRCSIAYIFYQKGRLTQDPDNAIASINDVLQDAQIIFDDKEIIRGNWIIRREALGWKTEIEIEGFD